MDIGNQIRVITIEPANVETLLPITAEASREPVAAAATPADHPATAPAQQPLACSTR